MREVARNLFNQLLYDDYTGSYIETCDQNFKRKFRAENDDEAIKIIGWDYHTLTGKHDVFEMWDCPYDQIPEVGEMFRVGPDVGRCIAKNSDLQNSSVVCTMLVDGDE